MLATPGNSSKARSEFPNDSDTVFNYGLIVVFQCMHKLPPVEAAKSTITEPGFKFSTVHGYQNRTFFL